MHDLPDCTGVRVSEPARIQVAVGRFALIDPQDFEAVTAFSWRIHVGSPSRTRRTEYAVKGGGDSKEYLHLWLWRHWGRPRVPVVDHEDGNGLNCQRLNLRQATVTQNNQHRGLIASNTSGYKGVSWHVGRGRWQAKISVESTRIFLGYFTTPAEAALAYNTAARKYHGAFAVLNTAAPAAEPVWHRVIAVVSACTGIKTAHIVGQNRVQSVVRARMIAMRACRLRQMSWHEIGRVFGGRDHSTAIAAIRRIEALMARSETVAAMVRAIDEQLAVPAGVGAASVDPETRDDGIDETGIGGGVRGSDGLHLVGGGVTHGDHDVLQATLGGESRDDLDEVVDGDRHAGSVAL